MRLPAQSFQLELQPLLLSSSFIFHVLLPFSVHALLIILLGCAVTLPLREHPRDRNSEI